MGWADNHIKQILNKETIQFRPHGDSMSGKIDDGQLVTVAPITAYPDLIIGDIVLCRVAGSQFLHLIKKIDHQGRRALIGNNKGHENGWTGFDRIYGKVIKVET